MGLPELGRQQQLQERGREWAQDMERSCLGLDYSGITGNCVTCSARGFGEVFPLWLLER